MELKEFVKNVLKDVTEAVEEYRGESSRDMHLDTSEGQRTVEFDIAVTVEDTIAGDGKAGVKIFQVLDAGGSVSKEVKNAQVSRIKFGVHVDRLTKQEEVQQRADIARINASNAENANQYM